MWCVVPRLTYGVNELWCAGHMSPLGREPFSVFFLLFFFVPMLACLDGMGDTPKVIVYMCSCPCMCLQVWGSSNKWSALLCGLQCHFVETKGLSSVIYPESCHHLIFLKSGNKPQPAHWNFNSYHVRWFGQGRRISYVKMSTVFHTLYDSELWYGAQLHTSSDRP